VKIREYGWDSLLLEVDDPVAWYRALRDNPETDVDEIVPAARTVLVRGIRHLPDLAQLTPAPVSEGAEQHTIAVTWDGADLDKVKPGTIEVMKATTFTVAFCGFSPGFAYMTGLPEQYQLPRLATPRTKVPRGSVAIGGPYASVYPTESPGGWLLLGTTETVLFDLSKEEPALLRPGTTVRFTDA
jgi:allophanate hydrolase subunit 1